MKYKITLLLFVAFLNVFSQEKEGDRDGTIFYPSIERTDEFYNINIDLYELGKVRYIEVELYDENNVKLNSKLVKLIQKNKKLYLKESEVEDVEIIIQNINLKLRNIDSSLNYPKVKVNLLNRDYGVLDYSQKIFY